MKSIGLMLAGAVCVTSGVVQAADSPAQAGYCMQYLRQLLTMVDEPIAANPPGTPPEARDALVAKQREMDAKVRSLIDQWRLYALSLPSADMQVSTEFLRGTAQAKSDIAYVNSQTDARTSECTKAQAAAPPGVDAMTPCIKEKQKADEADPMTAGIRERAAPCARGPSL